jgi:carbon starvation protein CstA
MSQSKKTFRSGLSKTFFLDVLFDRRTRPILIYAAIMIGLGAAVYHWLEGWDWLDSLYFVVITLTTIGYGDFSPTTPVTKIITIFYGLNGIILLLMFFDVIRTLRGWELREMKKSADKVDDR